MSNLSFTGQTGTVSNISSLQSIFTSDSLCGSGKSNAVVERVHSGTMAGERFVVAGPTLAQSCQFAADLKRRVAREKLSNWRAPFMVREINAETIRDDENMHVSKALEAELSPNFGENGRAICITHAFALNIECSANTNPPGR